MAARADDKGRRGLRRMCARVGEGRKGEREGGEEEVKRSGPQLYRLCKAAKRQGGTTCEGMCRYTHVCLCALGD